MSNDRANALERQPSAMNAKQTPSGLVLTLGDVLFDSGRATPNLGAGHTVDQPATFSKENPQRTVQINGYTDSTGSAALNQNLSDCRANSVKAALITRGIGSERINARGFGPSNPVTTNTQRQAANKTGASKSSFPTPRRDPCPKQSRMS
jgi:outer membrane protein OmpA-like peptidoglycan-associated protein